MIKMVVFWLPTFNWTKVELKQIYLVWKRLYPFAFNWTKVELKHGEAVDMNENETAFNWTKVELKLKRGDELWESGQLLIELR